MAQTLNSALVASGKSGTVLIADINAITASLLSSNSGASEPSYAVTGTFWFNTGDSLPYFKTASGSVPLAEAMGVLTETETEALIDTNRWLQPRAAAHYDGITPGVNASQGFSSIVRNSTGNYSFTFTTAEADALYLPQVTVLSGAANSVQVNNVTTTGFDVSVFDGANSPVNRGIFVEVKRII